MAPGWGTRVMAAQTGRVAYAGIRAGFGRLIILDGHGLEAAACSCYAAVKETYTRVLS